LVVVGVIAEVAIAALHPPYDSFWEQWGSSLANSVVAIGVALEIKFGQMAGLRQNELKRRSDENVAAAEIRASEANAAAIKATENAAKATERTVELSLALEDARAETLRLSRGISRHVSPAQAALLKSLCAGMHFRLLMIAQAEPEPMQYRDELARALANAGVEITDSIENTIIGAGSVGVAVYGAANEDAAGADLARILMQANVRGVFFVRTAGKQLAMRIGTNPTVP
jgi:hypothetical protein